MSFGIQLQAEIWFRLLKCKPLKVPDDSLCYLQDPIHVFYGRILADIVRDKLIVI